METMAKLLAGRHYSSPLLLLLCVCSYCFFLFSPSQAITIVALKLEPQKKRSRASPFEIGSGFLLCLWLAFYWFFLGLASAPPGFVSSPLFPQVLVSVRLCDLPVLSPVLLFRFLLCPCIFAFFFCCVLCPLFLSLDLHPFLCCWPVRPNPLWFCFLL
jgi:hypothetical protein